MPDPPRPGRAVYRDDVAAWHERRVDIYERFVRDELADDGCGAFLVWGDPALYDSTLRILDRVPRGAGPVHDQGRPGISSVQVLAAGSASSCTAWAPRCTSTTGRRLAEGGPPVRATTWW